MAVHTWHPDRDGYGTVLGPYEALPEWCAGYPVICHGVTWQEAQERFPGIMRGSEIPVTIEAP